jgi:hypothetical protein
MSKRQGIDESFLQIQHTTLSREIFYVPVDLLF